MKQQYLTAKEVADLEDISVSAVYKEIHRYTRAIGANKEILIKSSSLSMDAQLKLFSSHVDRTKPDDVNISDGEIYAAAPEHARKKADKYIMLINMSSGLYGSDLHTFVNQWNQMHPDKKTSYVRLLDARKKYQEDGIAGLLGQHGANAGTTKVTDQLNEFFKRIYLKQGRPSAQSCWKMVYGYAGQNGYDMSLENFPSAAAFVRRVRNEIPEQAIYFARNGKSAHNKKFAYTLKRNYDDVLPGECWVCDHAQIDAAAWYVKNQKVKYVFPWLTVWRDLKTGKMMGWDLHIEDPNTDHLLMSFHRGAREFGVPSEIIVDNGKDMRAKTLTGGRRKVRFEADEPKVRSLTGVLGIVVHFSWPYNGQSKPIERDFLRIKEWFSKHDTAYRGGTVVEKPEGLKDVIQKGAFMPFDEYKKVFDQMITEVINKTVVSSGYRQGQSPDSMWAAEHQLAIDTKKVRYVSENAIMLFCMRTTGDLSMGRRGVHVTSLGVDYYNPIMEGMKGYRKVYLRQDTNRMQEALVFDAKTDEFICKGYLATEVSALAHKNEVSRKDLESEISLKRSAEKFVKSVATVDLEHISTPEKMRLLAYGEKILAEERKNIDTDSMLVPALNKPVTITAMDEVMSKISRQEKQGLDDFSVLGLHRVRKEEEKKKIYTWPSERDAAMS